MFVCVALFMCQGVWVCVPSKKGQAVGKICNLIKRTERVQKPVQLRPFRFGPGSLFTLLKERVRSDPKRLKNRLQEGEEEEWTASEADPWASDFEEVVVRGQGIHETSWAMEEKETNSRQINSITLKRLLPNYFVTYFESIIVGCCVQYTSIESKNNENRWKVGNFELK